MEVVFLILIVDAVVFACFGAWIAAQKGRDASEGAIVGGIFGPLGALILVLLPSKEARPSAPAKRGRAGASRKSTLTAWGIPDDWEPTVSPPEPDPKAKDEEEDRALRYLSDN